MATRERMWKVAVAAVFRTNVLKTVTCRKCTPRFRAHGNSFTLILPTSSFKSWILAKRLGCPIRPSSERDDQKKCESRVVVSNLWQLAVLGTASWLTSWSSSAATERRRCGG